KRREKISNQLLFQGANIYIENKEEKTHLQVAKGGLGLIIKRLVESEEIWIYSYFVCFVVPSVLEADKLVHKVSHMNAEVLSSSKSYKHVVLFLPRYCSKLTICFPSTE
uniref:Uncharacterized protein n=1 Tax=Castor canadensis TaxID=51338 RepID=A0A8C0VVL9_CASCN